jgi:hypothetical protein
MSFISACISFPTLSIHTVGTYVKEFVHGDMGADDDNDDNPTMSFCSLCLVMSDVMYVCIG